MPITEKFYTDAEMTQLPPAGMRTVFNGYSDGTTSGEKCLRELDPEGNFRTVSAGGEIAAGLQFAVAQADGDESTKTVSIRTVTVSADGSSVYSGEAQTVLYDFNIPTEGA